MRLFELAALNQKLKFHDFVNYIIKSYSEGKNAAAKLSILHDEDRLNPAEFSVHLRQHLIPITVRNIDKIGNDVVIVYDEVKKDQS